MWELGLRHKKTLVHVDENREILISEAFRRMDAKLGKRLSNSCTNQGGPIERRLFAGLAGCKILKAPQKDIKVICTPLRLPLIIIIFHLSLLFFHLHGDDSEL